MIWFRHCHAADACCWKIFSHRLELKTTRCLSLFLLDDVTELTRIVREFNKALSASTIVDMLLFAIDLLRVALSERLLFQLTNSKAYQSESKLIVGCWKGFTLSLFLHSITVLLPASRTPLIYHSSFIYLSSMHKMRITQLRPESTPTELYVRVFVPRQIHYISHSPFARFVNFDSCPPHTLDSHQSKH